MINSAHVAMVRIARAGAPMREGEGVSQLMVEDAEMPSLSDAIEVAGLTPCRHAKISGGIVFSSGYMGRAGAGLRGSTSSAC